MDHARPERADRLAAAYVLGTLRGPARRRFESLLPAHPSLRRAVAAWETRLAPLSQSVEPVEPDPAVWTRIESRLFGEGALPTPGGEAAAVSTTPAAQRRPAEAWWQRLAPWRALTGLATAAAIALLVVVNQTPPAQAPVVIVLAPNPQAGGTLNASFVASVSADGRALVLRPIAPLSVEATRALELWAVPAQGAPRSLGLVQPGAATTLLRARLLDDTAALAVSLEPAGGSPTGAPTGPILSLGKLDS